MGKKRVLSGVMTGLAGVMAIIGMGTNLKVESIEASPAARGTSGGRQAVVVELFTSEGCSSCPAADRLLTWLAEKQPIAGVQIIPLSEHVDYWNQLGWADPYSSAALSQRQQEYSGSIGGGVYTPEMVVDGRIGFVGGDSGQAMEAISHVAHLPRATVRIEPSASPDPKARGNVSFSVRVEKLPPFEGKKKAVVFLAVTENNLRSSVSGGENSGRMLTHTAVVRELKSIGSLTPSRDAAFSAQPIVAISKEWKRSDLRAVVWVQVQGDHRILGAAESEFPAL